VTITDQIEALIREPTHPRQLLSANRSTLDGEAAWWRLGHDVLAGEGGGGDAGLGVTNGEETLCSSC
jgi:hypothetical protein